MLIFFKLPGNLSLAQDDFTTFEKKVTNADQSVKITKEELEDLKDFYAAIEMEPETPVSNVK